MKSQFAGLIAGVINHTTMHYDCHVTKAIVNAHTYLTSWGRVLPLLSYFFFLTTSRVYTCITTKYDWPQNEPHFKE